MIGGHRFRLAGARLFTLSDGRVVGTFRYYAVCAGGGGTHRAGSGRIWWRCSINHWRVFGMAVATRCLRLSVGKSALEWDSARGATWGGAT